MGEKNRRETIGYRRWERYGAYGSAGVAVAVALVMAVSPMAGALKPHVILPPFKGSASTIYKSISQSGNCKSTSALTSLHWVPKTGNVTGFAYSAAKGCLVVPTGSGYASAYTYAQFQVAIPVKVYTNTGHNFSVDFSYDYTLLASITGAAGCPPAKNVPGTYTYSYCNLDVSAGSFLSMELYDQTNNTYLYGGHDYVYPPENYSYVYNDSYCNGSGTCYNYSYSYSCHNSTYSTCVPSGTIASGTNNTWINSGSNCGYGYAGHCYYWHNWTLNSSHKYWVISYMEFYADAYLYGYGAGHSVLASVNGATLGNSGWKIVSVTVT
ncbi:MAG TPA: hypothetical protein VFF67_02470 [Thermoplasmata archaeon]|nr:hypothetical protein [Thermoplasmata archaeon]